MASIFPKVTQGRVDQNLTNVLLAYTNPAYFADRIFPTVGGLSDDSGFIPKFGRAHLRQYSAKRALWDETEHRISFELDTSETYKIDYFDLDTYIPDRLIQQWKMPFDAHAAAQTTVIEALKLSRDIAVASMLTSKTILTNNLDLTSNTARKYITAGTSTPLKDISDAIRAVFLKTGRKANVLTVQGKVADALRQHADIKAIAVAYVQGGVQANAALSEEGLVTTLKAWFKLDDVIIVDGIKETAKKGQTSSIGSVWGEDIVAFYRPATPSLMVPSFGYSFQLDGEVLRTVVRREPKADKGDLVEVDWAYQDKIVDADAAYLIKGCV